MKAYIQHSFLTVFFLGLFFVQNLIGSPVDSLKARQVAEAFIYKKLASSKLKSYKTVQSELLVTGISSNAPLYYIFRNVNMPGFIIMAADDRITPVLAYSVNSILPDSASMPRPFKDWLAGMKEQIIQLFNQPVSNAIKAPGWNQEFFSDIFAVNAEATAIEPLLKTTWDQGCYYNTLCPSDAGGQCGHVLAGCVAIAACQIMKFHNYPSTGKGSRSYDHYKYGTQSASFETTTYNWSSMPNKITSANADIAKLLYHFGVSVNMDYSIFGSGASSSMARDALVQYFKYSESASFVYKSSYSDANWISLLKAQIDKDQPIYYSAQFTATSGHAFVCDGYDNSGMFHFNWGWGGNADGYFLLTNLNPAGHSAAYNHRAIINIIPVAGPADNCQNSKNTIEIGVKNPNELIEIDKVTLIPEKPMPGEPVSVKIDWKANTCPSCIVKGNVYASWDTLTPLAAINDGLNETKSAIFNFNAPIKTGTYKLRFIWAFDIGRFSNYSGTNLPSPQNCNQWGSSASLQTEKVFQVEKNYEAKGNPCLGMPTIDYHGKTYHTVLIGDQCWFKENLNDGSIIATSLPQLNNSNLEKYCYFNDEDYCDAYGALYQWDEAMQHGQYSYNKGVCPTNWHVPADDDWKKLEKTIGMTQEEANGIWERGSDQSLQLRSERYWSGSAIPSNSSGFSILPSGKINIAGQGQSLNQWATFWTSSAVEESAWLRNFSGNSGQVDRSYDDKRNAFPIRCVLNSKYTISVTSFPLSSGMVSGAGSYYEGESITLNALPAQGYIFKNWKSGGIIVSQNAAYTIEVSSLKSFEAEFEPVKYSLTLLTNPVAGGGVTGEGIHNYNEQVSITALPQKGYLFTNWTENGSILSTNTTFTITITGNRTITAHFRLENYSILTTVSPSNSGSTTGSGNYLYGQQISLTATPAGGYKFLGWFEDNVVAETKAIYTFVSTKNRTLIAKFEPQTYTISAISENINDGNVTGGGTYSYFQDVALIATPAVGYSFRGWFLGDMLVSDSNPFKFSAVKNVSYTAKFEIIKVDISVAANIAEAGKISGDGKYSYNQAVSLEAIPFPGYNFSGWYNGNVLLNISNPLIFNAVEDIGITARFEKLSFSIETGKNIPDAGSVSGSGNYFYNESVTLDASPSLGYAFTGWYEGAIEVSHDSVYKFNCTTNRSIIAHFKQKQYQLQFKITSNQKPVENIALKIFQHGDLKTNSLGVVLIDSLKPGEKIQFSIENPPYKKIEGEVIIGFIDVIKEIELNPMTYLVNYSIKSGNNVSIVKAKVELFKNEILLTKDSTGNNGQVSFTLEPGEYKFKITADGFGFLEGVFTINDSPISHTIILQPTGINDIEMNGRVTVHPNPANSRIYFNADETIEKITIIDLAGRKVLLSKEKGTIVKIDISSLKAGQYIALVYFSEIKEPMQFKLIKE